MSLEGLHIAAALGGTRLSGAAGPLVLVERSRAHGLPALAILGRRLEDFQEALEAWEGCEVPLNLVGLFPMPGTDLRKVLREQRRRIGALTAALDVSLPWLEGKPMLPKRLPGSLAGKLQVGPAPMGPLEAAELRAFLTGWTEARIHRTFIQPEGKDPATPWWPDAPFPEGATLLTEPLRLGVGSPLMDALRGALRRALNQPVPLLPLPEDPSGLHALGVLTPKVAAFRGPAAAWALAMESLASLPAPPHFCARC